MKLPLPSLLSKALSVLSLAAVVILTTGCPEEGGGDPTPTPTPTPSPTPFPTPTPTPTPSSSASATSEEVVLTTARMVAAATEDSDGQLLATSESLETGELTTDDLTRAQALLESAREAFSLVEMSLFYTDPQNPEEQESLPSTLASRQPSLTLPGFDDLAAQLSQRVSGETFPSNADLLESVNLLRGEVELLETSWSSDSAGNFRNAIFLRDKEAPARILQGAVATTDFLILASLLPEKQFQIPSRLRSLRNVLDGTYTNSEGTVISGSGLLSLIAQTDPRRARRIQENLDALIQPYEQSGETPSPASSIAFETLRDDLLAAARRMGYRIEPLCDLPRSE